MPRRAAAIRIAKWSVGLLLLLATILLPLLLLGEWGARMSSEREAFAIITAAGGAALIAGPAALGWFYVVYRAADDGEREPWWAMAGCFAWGAVPAIALAGEGNLAFARFAFGHGLDSILVPVLGAPLVEEAAKAAGVLGVLWFLREELDGPADGIVYAAAVAAGFEFVENVTYVAPVFLDDPGDAASLAFLRCFVFGAVHIVFTSFTGAAIGRLRLAPRVLPELPGLVNAYGLAMLAHGAFNLYACTPGLLARLELPVLLPVGAIVALGGKFLTPTLVARWTASCVVPVRLAESAALADALEAEVAAGHVTRAEVETLFAPRTGSETKRDLERLHLLARLGKVAAHHRRDRAELLAGVEAEKIRARLAELRTPSPVVALSPQ